MSQNLRPWHADMFRHRRLFVHHHLGLGDTFTSNAIVRTLAESGSVERLDLFAKEINAANVRFLYRDEPRVHVVPLPLARDRPVGERTLVLAYLLAHRARPGQYLRIGFAHMRRLHRKFGLDLSCDQCFYAQVGLPYEWRFSRFHLKRDRDLEEAAYRKFNPDGGPYAFVDADPARGHSIPNMEASLRHGARQGLRRLYNPVDIPLVHMGLILERATELHLGESSIRCLVEGTEVFSLQAEKLFLYRFRGGVWGHNTGLPWIEIPPEGDEARQAVPYRNSPQQQELFRRASRYETHRWRPNPARRAIAQLAMP